jgi:RNA polymerase sigma-70 factor (ECF subfamily)
LRSWDQYESELHRWLLGHTPDRTDAEDLLQEVFLRAIHQGKHFCELSDPRAWLYKVARNLLTDRLRLSKAFIELPEDLKAESNQIATIDELSACLPRVLAELYKDDYEVLALCDLQGMSQADFAELKGLTLPAVKSRIQRARKRLKAQLAKSCQVQFDAAGKVWCFVPRPPMPELNRPGYRGGSLI